MLLAVRIEFQTLATCKTETSPPRKLKKSPDSHRNLFINRETHPLLGFISRENKPTLRYSSCWGVFNSSVVTRRVVANSHD